MTHILVNIGNINNSQQIFIKKKDSAWASEVWLELSTHESRGMLKLNI